MNPEALIAAIVERVITTAVQEIARGADERAAIKRASEELAAQIVHGPIAESVAARIDKVSR